MILGQSHVPDPSHRIGPIGPQGCPMTRKTLGRVGVAGYNGLC